MTRSFLPSPRVPLHRSMPAAVVLAAAAPVAAQNIDLALLGTVHPGFRIDGIDAQDYSGLSVSGAGDVNGDGLADLVVGAPSADPGGEPKAGETYVVFGKADSATVDLASLGPGGFRIDGIDGGDRSGASVSGAGDVNGDGLADLVIGADGGGPAGETYVVFGKVDATTVDLASLGSGGFRIDGIEASDISGWSVSGAGDVNGDGLADLVVGAPWGDSGGGRDAGESYVVFGKADSTTVDLASLGSGGFRIDGIDMDDYSGQSVSGAGDVNGDGLADLVVGAFHADPGGVRDAGETYVVFGKPDSIAVDLASLGSGGFRIDGVDAGDISGRRVSGAGDVNGDSLADLVVGAIYAKPGGNFRAGETYVVFGKADSTTVDLASLGSGGFRIDGIDANDNSGGNVAGAGDVNGDGLADLVVGASGADPRGVREAGETYVVFGKADSATVDLASLGSGGFRIDGIDSGDGSGSSVSGAGDVNGDGLADLVVGASGANPGGDFRAGESYVVFSPATSPTSATYKSVAPAGNAPRVAVGISGDGSDDDSPSSRCWIDFDAGTGSGNKQSSMQTVTLTRNDAGIRVLKPERLANVQWRIQTDRTGQRKTRVTLKYTDAEIAGLREETLRIWRASSPRGPWALYSAGMVREPQRNRISVVVPTLGYFVIEGEPSAP